MRTALTVIISTFIFTFSLSSCGRIKNKGEEFVDKTQEKVKGKAKDLVNKVVPIFDPYKADTKFNRARFREFFKIELTKDVKNIFCFGDEIGIDADYQFSFNCDPATAKRIIEMNHLKLDKTTTERTLGHDFKWWNKEKIAKLDLYSWQADRYFKYFWYDRAQRKAYYHDVDI